MTDCEKPAFSPISRGQWLQANNHMATVFVISSHMSATCRNILKHLLTMLTSDRGRLLAYIDFLTGWPQGINYYTSGGIDFRF